MIEEGYSRYKCDVKTCPKEDMAKPETPKALQYVRRTYQDANGTIKTIDLCQGHALQFKAIEEQHDLEVKAFIEGGALPKSIKGE